jgi:hypothetical protein
MLLHPIIIETGLFLSTYLLRMAQKFIIIDDQVIMGTVEFHRELVGDYHIKQGLKVIGGGSWHFDEENNILYFYGRSDDYGAVTAETFTKALKESLISPTLEEAQIKFSNELWFTNAVANCVDIQKPDNW